MTPFLPESRWWRSCWGIFYSPPHQPSIPSRSVWSYSPGLRTAEKIGEEKYADGTADKIRGFRNAAGTVLFFDDEEVTRSLQERFPTYAHNFPLWAEQVQGSHQYAAWLGLVGLGFGANLQHYTGLDDDQVREDAGVPSEYRFIAELVFGGMNSDTGEEKEKLPLSKTLRVVSE